MNKRNHFQIQVRVFNSNLKNLKTKFCHLKKNLFLLILIFLFQIIIFQ